MAATTLLFAWGNPSRGDDALGPAFLRGVAALLADHEGRDSVELLTDFQLQPEHVTDLDGRELVLFVDASVASQAPFCFARVAVRRDASFTSHAMTPAALLAAYEEVYARPAPPCYLLAIRGHCFELGEEISATALQHLERALGFARTLLDTPSSGFWDRMAGQAPPQPRL